MTTAGVAALAPGLSTTLTNRGAGTEAPYTLLVVTAVWWVVSGLDREGRARLLRDLRRLAALAARTARRDVDLSFAVVSDADIRALHRRALGLDHATDVLSYALIEEPVLVGEVVLSAELPR